MRWYEIKAKSDGPSEIWLYDEIGIWGIGAKEFIAELNAVKSPEIDMHINSPGGEVFEGNAIYNAIKRHPATVTSYIDGIAASIASVIALAGDKVVVAENGLYMMHNPSGLVIGSADDMRRTADVLDKIRDTMIGVYAGKSGKSDSAIREILDAETWYNADEAKAAGFVDEIAEKVDAAACAKFAPVMSRLGYKHVPQRLYAQRGEPSARDLEQALCDAGCSSSRAKTILARGFGDEPRDAAAAPSAPTSAEPPRDAAPLPTPARLDPDADLKLRIACALNRQS